MRVRLSITKTYIPILNWERIVARRRQRKRPFFDLAKIGVMFLLTAALLQCAAWAGQHRLFEHDDPMKVAYSFSAQ